MSEELMNTPPAGECDAMDCDIDYSNLPLPPPFEVDDDIEEYIELEERINEEKEKDEKQQDAISRLVIARENVRNVINNYEELVEGDLIKIMQSLDDYIMKHCKHSFVNDTIETCHGEDVECIQIRYCENCFSADDSAPSSAENVTIINEPPLT